MECHGYLEENEIIAMVKSSTEMDEENVEEDDNEEMHVIPSHKEALNAVSVLEKYCFSNNIDISIDKIETEIVNGLMKSAKQTVISDYFS